MLAEAARKMPFTEWLEISELNFDGRPLVAHAGLMERGKQPLLQIQIGGIGTQEFYYRELSSSDLAEVGRNAVAKLLHFGNERRYYRVDWIIEARVVRAIRFELKANSSDSPSIRILHFSASPLELKTVEIISTNDVYEHSNSTPYPTLPEPQFIGPRTEEFPRRKPKVFVQGGTIGLQLLVDKTNPIATLQTTQTSFETHITLFNCTKSVILVKDFNVYSRFAGEPHYKANVGISSCSIELPFHLLPSESVEMHLHLLTNCESRFFLFSVHLLIFVQDEGLDLLRPIRFKFEALDFFGGRSSLVIEYIKPITRTFLLAHKNVVGYLFDPEWLSEVEIGWTSEVDRISGHTEFTVTGCRLNSSDFPEHVYKAKKSGKTEISVQFTYASGAVRSMQVIALIDLSCNVVYALKCLVSNKHAAVKFYIPVAPYFQSHSTREPQLAVEVEELKVQEADWPRFLAVPDDDLDDIHETPQEKVERDVAPSGHTVGVEALAELVRNTERLATALERAREIAEKRLISA